MLNGVLDTASLTEIVKELVAQQRETKDTLDKLRHSTVGLVPYSSADNCLHPHTTSVSISLLISELVQMKESVSVIVGDVKNIRTEQVTVNLQLQKQIVHLDNQLAQAKTEMQLIANNVTACHSAVTTLSESVYNDMQSISNAVRVVRNENDEKVDLVNSKLKEQLQKTLDVEEALVAATASLTVQQKQSHSSIALALQQGIESLTKHSSVHGVIGLPDGHGSSPDLRTPRKRDFLQTSHVSDNSDGSRRGMSFDSYNNNDPSRHRTENNGQQTHRITTTVGTNNDPLTSTMRTLVEAYHTAAQHDLKNLSNKMVQMQIKHDRELQDTHQHTTQRLEELIQSYDRQLKQGQDSVKGIEQRIVIVANKVSGLDRNMTTDLNGLTHKLTQLDSSLSLLGSDCRAMYESFGTRLNELKPPPPPMHPPAEFMVQQLHQELTKLKSKQDTVNREALGRIHDVQNDMVKHSLSQDQRLETIAQQLSSELGSHSRSIATLQGSQTLTRRPTTATRVPSAYSLGEWRVVPQAEDVSGMSIDTRGFGDSQSLTNVLYTNTQTQPSLKEHTQDNGPLADATESSLASPQMTLPVLRRPSTKSIETLTQQPKPLVQGNQVALGLILAAMNPDSKLQTQSLSNGKKTQTIGRTGTSSRLTVRKDK